MLAGESLRLIIRSPAQIPHNLIEYNPHAGIIHCQVRPRSLLRGFCMDFVAAPLVPSGYDVVALGGDKPRPYKKVNYLC